MKKSFLLTLIIVLALLPSGCATKETGDKILGINRQPSQQQTQNDSDNKTEHFYTKEARYYKTLADKHQKDGNIETAIDYYNKSIKTDPTFYPSFKELGLIYEKKYKEYDKAKEYYEKALAMNPDDPPLLYKMGNIYIHYDKYPEAISYFQKAIKLLPDYAEAYRNMGLAYSLNNQPDKAIENYMAAIFLEPEDPITYYNLGNAYTTKCPFKSNILDFFKEKNCTEAISAYETSIKLKPDYIKAYANLAHLYLKKGNKEKAELYYKKALKIDPKNAIIQKSLNSLNQSNKPDNKVNKEKKDTKNAKK